MKIRIAQLVKCLGCSILALLPSPLQAATIRVPLDVLTIKAGIQLAAPGDTVLVSPGTYTGPDNKNLEFYSKDIALIGEGGSQNTIIDCQQEGRGIWFAGDESRAALVQGITIRNGYVHLDGENYGGGIRIMTASPTIRDVIVSECVGTYTGGLCVDYGGSPLIENCRFENNQSLFGDGGGLCLCNGSNAELQDVIICGNSGWYGGGVDVCHSDPVFRRVQFIENSASGYGGAVFSGGDCTALLEDCHFIRNHSGRSGGALALMGEPAIVRNCEFIANSAAVRGGAAYLLGDYGSVFQDCLVVGNSAAAGGAIYLGEYAAYPNSQFINVTIAGNQAFGGAGSAVCANWQAEGDFVNCLITGNLGGAALWTDHGAGIYPACSNIWGNPSGNYGGDLADQTDVDGNISADPLFCAPDDEDYSVAAQSPCLPANNECGVLMGVYGEGCTLTAVEDEAVEARLLISSSPNPFNGTTCIRFNLPAPYAVSLEVFDLSGRMVRQLLVEEPRLAGEHAIFWRGEDDQGRRQPSGIYLYRLSTPEGQLAGKMTLVQ